MFHSFRDSDPGAAHSVAMPPAGSAGPQPKCLGASPGQQQAGWRAMILGTFRFRGVSKAQDLGFQRPGVD